MAGLPAPDSEMVKSSVEAGMRRPSLRGHKESEDLMGMLAKSPILHSPFACVYSE
jgi:hypothetical protein